MTEYNDPELAAAITLADQANKDLAASSAAMRDLYTELGAAVAKQEVDRKALAMAGANLALEASGYLSVVPPPIIIDPPPVDPGDPPPTTTAPSDAIWKTDSATIPGIRQAPSYIPFSDWWPSHTQPREVPTAAMKGTWRGWEGFDPATGQYGTLWFLRWFDAYGLIEDVELWDIGDFTKGREGHGFYVNAAPHLDLTVRRVKVYKNGANAFQREFRTTETALPPTMWQGGGGTFTIEDMEAQETGLIDEVHGGESVRASWTLALYATMQRTIVRRFKHINYYSPAPHEGSIWIGPGQSGFTTPYALVEDCDLWTESHDRAEVFFARCNEAIIRRTFLRGSANYICVANDCKKFVVSDMPQDVEVRVQPKEKYHGPPVQQYIVPKGVTKELTFA